MSKKRYRYIICDLDGTLLDDTERHYRCYADIVQQYGGTCVSKEEYWDMKRKKVTRDVLLKKTQFGGTYEQYLSEWIARIETPEYLRYEKPKDGALELLALLRKQTEQLYLATLRQNRENLLVQLDELKLTAYFDKIYSTSPLKEKSKAELLGELPIGNDAQSENFGTDNTDHILVIGDSEADEELAGTLGASFWAMTDGLRSADAFETPYRFCGAGEMIERMQELPE